MSPPQPVFRKTSGGRREGHERGPRRERGAQVGDAAEIQAREVGEGEVRWVW